MADPSDIPVLAAVCVFPVVCSLSILVFSLLLLCASSIKSARALAGQL